MSQALQDRHSQGVLIKEELEGVLLLILRDPNLNRGIVDISGTGVSNTTLANWITRYGEEFDARAAQEAERIRIEGVRATALAKLTQEEKESLGLFEDDD